MNNDRLFLAQLEDRLRKSENRYMIVSGDFMDAHQKKLATDFMRQEKIPELTAAGEGYSGTRYIFWGGYEDAERTVPVFVPEYEDMEGVKELLSVVRTTVRPGGRKLTHRDYLGSLMGLGIDREVIGDILVRGEDSQTGPGADIVVQAEMADYIAMNYAKAGRTELKTEIIPIDEIDKGSMTMLYKTDTVASLRLDSILASGFSMSRAKAADAIRAGLVAIDGVETLKTDTEVDEGSRISFRGKGRMILEEVGGKSRKGRVFIKTGTPEI